MSLTKITYTLTFDDGQEIVRYVQLKNNPTSEVVSKTLEILASQISRELKKTEEN